MKKEYIIPMIEIFSSQLEQAMMGHSDDWAEGKEHSFEEEDEFYSTKDAEFKSLWDDEDEEQ